MTDTPDDKPSQAEGDVGDDNATSSDATEGPPTTTDDDGTPVENPSG